MLLVQGMEHALLPNGFDLSEENGIRVPVRTIGDDIVSNLLLAIWIHKNDLPLAEHGLHRIVLTFTATVRFPETSVVSSTASAWMTPGRFVFVTI
jgi:hypothetical protein